MNRPLAFQQELEALINRHSQENGSDTPDFILAQYLTDCLVAWNEGMQLREKWYGREIHSPATSLPPQPSDPPLAHTEG